MDDRDRLVTTIHKLEEKVRKLRSDQNSLEQELELASLDKELAEERSRALEAELTAARGRTNTEALQRRISELEELCELNAELEESWLQRESALTSQVEDNRLARLQAESRVLELQQKVDMLEKRQEENTEAQGLKVELDRLKFKLAAVGRQLEVQREGLFPMLAKLGVNDAFFLGWASSQDLNLRERVLQVWDQFQTGDIDVSRMGAQLASISKSVRVEIAPCLDMSVVELLRAKLGASEAIIALATLVEEGASAPADLVRRAILDPSEELLAAIRNAAILSLEPKPDTVQVHANTDELAAAQARVQVLESKMAKARDLAARVHELEDAGIESQHEKKALEAELASARQLSMAKDREIGRLRQAQLPDTLEAASVHEQIRGMRAAIAYLSNSRTSSPHLIPMRLDPLDVPTLNPPTNLAGHPLLRRIRVAVETFDIVKDPHKRWRTSINQYCELMCLDRSTV